MCAPRMCLQMCVRKRVSANVCPTYSPPDECREGVPQVCVAHACTRCVSQMSVADVVPHIWVPGHSRPRANDSADWLAEQGAECIEEYSSRLVREVTSLKDGLAAR